MLESFVFSVRSQFEQTIYRIFLPVVRLTRIFEHKRAKVTVSFSRNAQHEFNGADAKVMRLVKMDVLLRLFVYSTTSRQSVFVSISHFPFRTSFNSFYRMLRFSLFHMLMQISRKILQPNRKRKKESNGIVFAFIISVENAARPKDALSIFQFFSIHKRMTGARARTTSRMMIRIRIIKMIIIIMAHGSRHRSAYFAVFLVLPSRCRHRQQHRPTHSQREWKIH